MLGFMQIHILSREMVYLGLMLLKYVSSNIVDSFMVILSKLMYGGDTTISKYGISRPEEGPFFLKVKYGKYPVIDTGTIGKIKSGVIQVLPKLVSTRGGEAVFEGGKSHPFDVIIFATGFKRSTNKWLKVIQLLHSLTYPEYEMNFFFPSQSKFLKSKVDLDSKFEPPEGLV